MEEVRVIEHYLMVRMPQEVDHYKSSYICEETDQKILTEDVENIVFDFEDTKFMDSSGIGIIMGRYKKITALGGRVIVLHPDPYIKKLLMLSGIDRYVEIME